MKILEFTKELKFDCLFESSLNSILFLDAYGKIVDLNSRAEKLFGIRREICTGKYYPNYLPGVESKTIDLINKVAEDGPEIIEHSSGENGSTRFYRTEIRPMLDSNAEFIGAISITKDETSRLRKQEEIKKQKDFTESLFQNMISGFALHEIISDEEGKPVDYIFLDINKAFEDITGLISADIKGKRVTDILPGTENDPADWIGRYGKIAMTGSRETFESYSVNLNKWFVVSAYSPEKGKFATIFQDITKRVEAENKLKRNEEKLRLIIENSTNLFYSHTAEHELTYLSPQCIDYLDCEPEKAMKRWTEFATDNPVNKIGFENTVRAIETGERQTPYDLELNSAKGRKFWVEVRETPVVKHNKTVAIVGSLHDITERKSAETALKQSEALFRKVLENIRLIGLMLDENGKITFCNKFLLNLTGHKYDEVIGEDLFEKFLPLEIQQEHKEMFFSTINDIELHVVHENEITTKDGERKLIKWFNTEMRDESGKLFGITSIGEDVTAKRKSQERFRLITEITTDITYEWDLKTDNISWFGDIDAALGYSKGTIKPNLESWYDLIHPDELEYLKNILNEFYNKSNELFIEYRIRDSKGRWRHWQEKGLVILDENGKPGKVLGACLDITEKRRAELELINRERQFRFLAENAFSLIRSYELDEILGFATNKLFEITNGEASVFVCKFNDNTNRWSIFDIKFSDDMDIQSSLKFIEHVKSIEIRNNRWINEKLLSGRLVEFEEDLTKLIKILKLPEELISSLNNTDIEKILCLSFTYNNNFYGTGWLVYSQNVENINKPLLEAFSVQISTALNRVHNEKQRLDAETTFRSLFESSNDAILVIDAETSLIVDVNKAALDLYGFRRSELLGLNPVMLSAEPGSFFSILDSTDKIPLNKVRQSIHIKKNGSRFHVEFRFSLYESSGKKYLAVLVRDISERERYERELSQAHKQIQAFAEHLQNAREEDRKLISQDLHDELGSFLAGINFSLGYIIKEAKKKIKNNKIIEEIDAMRKSVKTGMIKLNDMIAKIRPNVLEGLSISEAVEWLVENFREKSNVSCNLVTNVDYINLSDKQMTAIFRILQESLTNVIKHAKAKNVLVKLIQKDDFLILTVKDNGRGFDSDNARKFSFGLVGIKERAASCNGNISIKSKRGKGTEVTLQVPIEEGD